eukprot:gene434-468_t
MFGRTRPTQNRVIAEINSNSLSALYLQTSEHEERSVHESRLFSALTSKAVTSGKLQKSDLAELNEHIKLGVLFLNLGGPEKTEDVEGFLYNLFADPDIIRLPSLLSILQKPLAYFIAKRRAPKSSAAYQSIGGGSPIVNYTSTQAQLVQEALVSRGFSNAKCYFAMRYWHPFTENVLQQMHEDGINTMVIVPLYPQFSISTSGSSLRLLQDIFYKAPHLWGPDKIAHTVVPAWYHRKGYVKLMARLILDKLVQYNNAELVQGVHVLFSAHGVPQYYIEAGDPYQRQIEECVKLISEEVRAQLISDKLRPKKITKQQALELAGRSKIERADLVDRLDDVFSGDEENAAMATINFHLSFQSRVGPVQWLTPYTEEMIVDLGENRKVRNLIVVPISFVSEHIETLEEIDMEYQELAHEHGIVNWKRVPALNTESEFIEDMAELVVEALEAPTLTVAEAASKSYSDMLSQQALAVHRRMEILREDVESADVSGEFVGQGDFAAFGLWGAAARQQVASRKKSLMKGRFAVLGLMGTTLLELVSTHPALHIVGFK